MRLFSLLILFISIQYALHGQTVIGTDPGFMVQNTDGPTPPHIVSADISDCYKVGFSFDFEFSQSWEGDGNMESWDECGEFGDCAGDPNFPDSGSCLNCWDFLWTRLFVDGAEIYNGLIGDETVTDEDQMGTWSETFCVEGTTMDLNLVSQFWQATEGVIVSNIMLLCYEKDLTISSNSPICNDEQLDLNANTSDPDLIGFNWSSDQTAVIDDPFSLNTYATNVSNGETFTLEVTDVDGCTYEEMLVADVLENPEVNFVDFPTDPICAGTCEDVTLEIIDGTGNYDIDFSFGFSTFSLSDVPSGLYTFSICNNNIDDISLPSPVDAAFTITDITSSFGTGCTPTIGDMYTFPLSTVDAPTGSDLNAEQCPEPGETFAIFDLEELTSAVDPTFTIYYYESNQSTTIAVPGLYQTGTDVTVYYVITDNNGCQSDFIPIDLTVGNLPTINASLITICDETMVNLNDYNSHINVIDDVFWYDGEPFNGGTQIIAFPTDLTGVDLWVEVNDGICSNILPIDVDALNITLESSSIMCDDNGTPGDASDDTYSVTVNLSGGAGSWTADDPLMTSGSYDTDVVLSDFPISGGDVTITFTDNDDPTCSITETFVAPAACSDACDIAIAIQNIQCLDNGTPSDPSDDSFTFEGLITGTNVGTSWTSDGVVTSGNYNTLTPLGTYPISGGGITLSFTDIDDASCTENITIDPPATCSEQCSIAATVSNIVCNDNGTPLDDSDDTFTFDVMVNGSNTGTGWTADDGSTGNYGTTTSLGPYPISSGDITLILTDDSDNNCTVNITATAPGTCSTQCSITASVSNVQCNDNGTPLDDSDDTYSYDVIVNGSNTGTGWTADDGSTGTYGTATTISGLLISDGDIILTISDDDDGTCTTMVSVTAPATCSNGCSLDATVSNVNCNDNGTPTDASDDTYTFDVVVNGTNAGTTWTADNGSTGNYGTTITIGPIPIANGNTTLVITDDSDNTCTTTVTAVAPNTCSGACDITANYTILSCDDNGTPAVPTDDLYSIEVTVTGTNTGTSWMVNDPTGTTGAYGVATVVGPFEINDGIFILTLVDTDDPSCTTELMITPPPPCSSGCTLTASALNRVCDDNGTPEDLTDDTWTFDLLVNGSNTGTGWTATDEDMTAGEYGTTYTFGPFSVDSTMVSFTIIDNVNNNCLLTISVDAPNCECTSPAMVDIIPDVTSICAGDSIWLQANLINATTGTWQATGGHFSSPDTTETFFTTAMPGMYTITFTTDDADGTGPCLPEEAALTVEVLSKPSANIISTQQVCGGIGSINLSDLDFLINGDFPVIWYEDEGLTPIPNPADFQNIPDTSFTLYAQVDNGQCTSNFLAVNFNVIEEVIINIPNNTTLCSGPATIDLTAYESEISDNASYILWFTEADENSEITVPESYDISNFDDNFTVFVQAGLGACKTDFVPITFTIGENVEIIIQEETCDPEYSIDIQGTVYDASNPSGELMITGENGDCDTLYMVDLVFLESEIVDINETICDDTYALNIGNTIFNINNPSGQAIATGMDGECDTTYNVNLNYDVPTFTVNGGTACPGDPFIVHISSDNFTSSTLDIAIDGMELTITSEDLPFEVEVTNAAGSYTISYNDACPAITGNYTVNTIDKIEWTVDYMDSLLMAELLNANTDELDEFYWSPPSLVDCDTCLTTTHNELSADQLFTAHIRYNMICVDTQQIFIDIPEVTKYEYDFPNVIDPTSGGNGEFFVFVPDDATDRVLEMHIYDRWGNKIFTSQDAELLSNRGGWNGRYGNGDLVQPGVYVFLIKIETGDGVIETYSGDITVLR